jgi:excisionase family DNA binding protein
MPSSYWTKQDTDLAIRMHDQKRTYQQIADALGKTRLSVANKMQRMKVKSLNYSFEKWTTEEIEILRQEYNGKSPAKKCQKALKERLGKDRTTGAIQHKVKEYGLQVVCLKSFPKAGEFWSAREDEFLQENRQRRSIYWLSEKMGRSLASVNWRCSVLKINADSRDGWYTMKEASEVLGIHVSVLRKLVKEDRIKAIRRNGGNTDSDWEIKEADIYSFVTRYPQFLQNRKPDMIQLIDILTKGGIKYTI